jgi:hypothetical protein
VPQRETSIALKGQYGLDSLDQLIADLTPLLTLIDRTRLTIDLRELSFVYPSTAALLALALHRVVALDLRVPEESRFLLPANENVRNYLFRADVLQVGAGIKIVEPFTRQQSRGFRECRRFETEAEATQVARELTNALEERSALDPTARSAIYTCLGELCFNVPHHAASQTGGVASAQGYPQLHRFEATIVDLGIGIRQSLRQNTIYASVASDVEAIETALELGVTSKPGDKGPTRHSGYGLSVTQHLLKRNGGRLVVRSGQGEIHVGAAPKAQESEFDFPGTLVVMEAWTNAPLDVSVVYQELLGDLDD